MGNSRAQPSPETLLGHADFVCAVARGLLVDEHRVDDVVQETWLAALRQPPRADWRWRPWLAGVARNLARRRVREETRRRARERAAACGGWERPTAEIVASEATRRRVVRAVLALDEPYRTAVLLRYYDDLAPREIAQRLGLPGAPVVDRDDRLVSVVFARVLVDAGPAAPFGHLDVHPRLLLREACVEAVLRYQRLAGLALLDVERAASDVEQHRAVDDGGPLEHQLGALRDGGTPGQRLARYGDRSRKN